MHIIGQITAASALFAVAHTSPLVDKRLDVNKDFVVRQSWVQKSTIKSGPKAYASVFAKYGKEIPADVAAAAANNDGVVVTTPTIYDSEYLTPVTIGGQTVNLDFDTGSSDLWVYSSELPTTQTNGHDIYDPSKSTTSKKLAGATWSITYGDGSSSSGDVYTDTVSIGATTFQNQAVELAQRVSEQFQRDVNNDGLLGLAFSSINTVRPTKQLTFFDNVKSSLSAPIFAVDLRKGQPGTYAFGTTDASKYTGQISYVNVDNRQGFWSFTTSGYAVGNDAVNTNSVTGIADTGTTLLLIDDNVVRAYYARVAGARNDPLQGGYTYPCSTTLPNISFQIGSYKATVPGSYVNYAPVDDTGVTCFGGIQSSRGIGINIFGDIFLKSQYVVFEGRATPRLGFAAKPL